MQWWLFSDYDGTLRNGADGKVDPSDLRFVQEFIAQNQVFVIASGRPYEQMLYEMKTLKIQSSFYITNAGAIIRDQHGKILYQCVLPHQDRDVIIDYLENQELQSLIYATPFEEFYLFTDHPSYYENGQLKRKVTNYSFIDLKSFELVCFKIQEKREKLDQIALDVQRIAPNLTIIKNNDSEVLEIHPPHSSKRHAIQVLQKKFNVSDNQVIVVGDDDNDVGMIEYFENSFVINQPYNKAIQPLATYQIDHLFEIENFLKK
ncbi:Sugar phosphatase YbiV [Mesoplasma sp. JKS002658]|uniref:HAD-IIB family hydrolase n=1 Tax=Mesoplasma whartonense TaxID=2878854 RepID=UPI002022A6A5|nr:MULTISPECIES: HAD-IIB family hydrolase [unclassified Mesoplasma]MCL8211512.1 Sugar phosphatase YbiV [Mesoplasma sp. JKS002664]MCL8211972.1 Sugar phosphatase YbiV [Mesoplasma sp. JKS002662]MCL8213923.1 Sugar phosphatase YbiV [Mesoplasma sp. JKS002658]MCL8214889.1 Sugar phosphatase YbiV [Mesoplasma sp. JKS002663]MCL8215242.1 Sugar phosphatase YbiV [Mesoplasma sp. JKS002659]